MNCTTTTTSMTAGELSDYLDAIEINTGFRLPYIDMDFRGYYPDRWQMPKWLAPNYCVSDDRTTMFFSFPDFDGTALTIKYAGYHTELLESIALAAGCEKIAMRSGKFEVPPYSANRRTWFEIAVS